MKQSMLTKNQKKVFTKFYKEGGKQKRIDMEIRYDDECNNGHNCFAMTANISRKAEKNRWVWDGGGCCHEEIAKRFPEYAKYIKWHLCGSNGPMYYLENTLYHAGNRDHNGLLRGEVNHRHDKTSIKFGSFPKLFDYNKLVLSVLRGEVDGVDIKNMQFMPIAHGPDKDGYHYADKYTFVTDSEKISKKWHECPFDTVGEALLLADMLKWCDYQYEFVVIPTAWGDGKERDFDAARSCAIWPDATDEELSLPREELKQKLVDRLPALMEEFIHDVEELGFVY